MKELLHDARYLAACLPKYAIYKWQNVTEWRKGLAVKASYFAEVWRNQLIIFAARTVLRPFNR